ncbi:MAG: hypothetical protein ACM4D3_18460 [Candidatus Sericytochromatia bacterium]
MWRPSGVVIGVASVTGAFGASWALVGGAVTAGVVGAGATEAAGAVGSAAGRWGVGADTVGAASAMGVCGGAVSVLVCAPPELLITTGGLVLPGALSVVEVCDGEEAEVCDGDPVLLGEVLVVAEVSEVAVLEVWAPPELLTVTVGPAPVVVVLVEVSVLAVPGRVAVEVLDPPDCALLVSLSVDADVEVEEVFESVSVGSAHATPGVRASAAPTPRATASNPARPR